MDLSDVIDRAELHTELAQRLGVRPDNGRRLRLGAEDAATVRLFETACLFYGSARPEALVKVVKRAHEKYTDPEAYRTAGFLNFLFREMAPQAPIDAPLPVREEEWAARVMEAIRAGLGDPGFSRLINTLDDVLKALDSEVELVPTA